ncbi:ATP-dependent DNA helicase [Clostridium sp. DL1XJH146]
MLAQNIIKISVRNLVQFVLKSGDLVSTFKGSSRNVDAIRAHQKIQKGYGDNYSSEVTLSILIKQQDFMIEVKGRADGVFNDGENVLIDEIKTTMVPLEFIDENYNGVHWAQAKCYAYFYCVENEVENIEVQLTYYNLDNKNIKRIKRGFTKEELGNFFNNLLSSYIKWADTLDMWIKKRNNSIKELKFPYGEYREGQRKLAVYTYKTIKDNKKLFAQAPTGIGKTIATIFPALKAVGEDLGEKIFYLTAKTITRTTAENTYLQLREAGLSFKTLTLTAKEKICFNDEVNCNPDKCPYARGHFDRVNEAIFDIFNEDNMTRDVVEKYARKYNICPFEFSLDLVFWVDGIICDYNYVFDPRASLKRFFDDTKRNSILLIDEAHNLVDRGREMFSADLVKKDILELKKESRNQIPELFKILNKLNTYFIELRKKCEKNNGYFMLEKRPEEILPHLIKYINKAEKWMLENKNEKSDCKDKILDFYFKALFFIKIGEIFDESYRVYAEKIDKNDVILKLYCVNPSKFLKESIDNNLATIIFSATLSPMDYYFEVLGGEQDDNKLRLKSSFKRENLLLLIDDKISTKYRNREETAEFVIEKIKGLISSKKGNYLVFFPSYKYLRMILERIDDNTINFNIISQEIGMDETQKEEFLENFNEIRDKSLVAFAVMGGMFGEGIDLVGEKLSGAIIIGVGLPQICFQRDIIRDYFNEKKGCGFEYSYIYPGMNKVMQAVGRIIRTEKDKGVALLIDTRFTSSRYLKLFPYEWQHLKRIQNTNEMSNYLEEFWK